MWCLLKTWRLHDTCFESAGPRQLDGNAMPTHESCEKLENFKAAWRILRKFQGLGFKKLGGNVRLAAGRVEDLKISQLHSAFLGNSKAWGRDGRQ